MQTIFIFCFISNCHSAFWSISTRISHIITLTFSWNIVPTSHILGYFILVPEANVPNMKIFFGRERMSKCYLTVSNCEVRVYTRETIYTPQFHTLSLAFNAFLSSLRSLHLFVTKIARICVVDLTFAVGNTANVSWKSKRIGLLRSEWNRRHCGIFTLHN